jgi:hypothetical protein
MGFSFYHLRRGAFIITVAFLLWAHISVLSSVHAQELSPQEKIQKSAQISDRVAEMVAQAESAGDPRIMEKALELAREASNLISDVIATADMKEDKDMLLTALDLANRLDASVAQIRGTALNLAQTTTESEVADTVERLIRVAEGLNLDHAKMIKTVRENGILPRAEGYEPPQSPSFDLPFSEEPPIQDAQAASAV